MKHFKNIDKYFGTKYKNQISKEWKVIFYLILCIMILQYFFLGRGYHGS